MNETIDAAIVMGTYNRLPLLQACVESIRWSVGKLTYVCLVCDGGSNDGTREWLVKQPDCELLEGGMDGAVRAFNVGFSRAVDLEPECVGVLNDDDALPGHEHAISDAVAAIRADAEIGAVVFRSNLRGDWACEACHANGQFIYPNKGVIRLAAGMAAARAQGDPTGKDWWNPCYHTYGADSEHGMWMWRLGWRCVPGGRVHDVRSTMPGLAHMDELRQRNKALYGDTGKVFVSRWGKLEQCAYHREDAERFGGLLR